LDSTGAGTVVFDGGAISSSPALSDESSFDFEDGV